MAELVTRVPMSKDDIKNLVQTKLNGITWPREFTLRAELYTIESKLREENPEVENLTMEEVVEAVLSIMEQMSFKVSNPTSKKNDYGKLKISFVLEFQFPNTSS